ncbi:MAG: helix-turn-helix domain-containing protein [Clostridiales bacterium]|nr:helix-turn-helix domain-containing protein [Clostridiales bacterium]
MKLGDILRELLELNDITQKQLASDLNLASTTIGNYIRNLREPDFETLKLLAAYFNVTTDYLLDFQSGRGKDHTKDHTEDELLRICRSLPPDKRELLLEQGKLLVRFQIKEQA